MERILLLEDEESVNRGVSFTLDKEGYDVCSCRTVEEALRVFDEFSPQLLICDVTLPDGSGLDVVRYARERSGAYIICLTALDSEIDQVMGYESGADDYVTKPFSLSVLALKVRAFFARQQGREGGSVESGELRIEPASMKVWKRDRELSLTKNEWKLLNLFISNPGRVLSKNQILERLFDAEGNFVDENTIAVNIRCLREKIEENSSDPQYIKNIRGLGYLWNKECRES